MNKNINPYAGVILAVVFVFFASVIGVNNKAVTLETNIQESKSGIGIQEKRQHDLIKQLVQVVEHGANYDSSTQISVAQLRSTAENNVGEAMSVIMAVAEAYPDLKANSLYVQLMTEISISENLKAQYRSAYNRDVKLYQVHVAKYPNSAFLNLAGYSVMKFEFLEFDELELTVPDDLLSE